MRRRLISSTRPTIAISLFAEPSLAPRAPSSMVFSLVAHGALAAGFYFALTQAPQIIDPAMLKHFAVRQLDLHRLDPHFPKLPAEAESPKIPYPGPWPRGAKQVTPDLADAMRTFLSSAAGRQTLIQPEFHSHVSFTQPVPLPSVMIWTPGQVPPKKIVAPLPDPDTSSYVKPSLDLPNQEVKLSNIAVATSNISPRIESMPATTTSPVESPTVKPVQKPLLTMSQSTEQPTAAAVISVSELRMEEGTLFVPPVNDIARSTTADATKPGNGVASGAGNGAGDTGRGGADAPDLSDAESMRADGTRLTAEHIALPHDGRFNVVAVGNSLSEDYPETAEFWGTRVAYTAYLHVGLKKNWILQYSVTRSADLAAAGNVTRLEAPWPYEIKRPNLLSRDLGADALMVHGVLNQTGRLESLAIVFPGGFRYSSYVLYALRQWQFRPARQNGQATPVEVLLIIPEELD